MKPTTDIIGALHAGKLDAVDELYMHYREAFFKWAGKRFVANRQDCEDAWQEAVIALYTQVMSGKLTTLRYDARVWLFAVGYKRLLNNNRKVKRILPNAANRAESKIFAGGQSQQSGSRR